MTGASVTQVLETFTEMEDGKPCTCGGTVVVGHTPIACKAAHIQVYECTAHANCNKCGAGYQIMIVEETL